MFYLGPLGCPLPAVSSCGERAWCRWERLKGVLCVLLSSVQEPCGPTHFLLRGEQPLLTDCPWDQPSAELWG